MNVPKDQGLFFAGFSAICLLSALTFWIFLPVYHREEEEKNSKLEMLSSEERILKSEMILKKATEALDALEETDKQGKTKGTAKSKSGSPAGKKGDPGGEPTEAKKIPPEEPKANPK